MKTTQEKANQLRAMLDMPKFLQRLDVEDVRALLDDRDELARLREGLKDKAAKWKGAVSAMERIQELRGYDFEKRIGYRHALGDCADEIQELLNGVGDGDE